jgi:cyclohexanone monooxygenase
MNERSDLDAIVVGAGFAGIYMLIKLRELGLATRVFETGGGVGGTWYWNRYPGARCDVPSMNYSYSFSPELEQEWHWSERYATQPEIERYANHVVERFQLRRDIQLNTPVASARYEESASRWEVRTSTDERFTARFLILATGGYSKPVHPDIPGIDNFGGETYFTAQWPHESVDVTGKRIGVIGTGASGMQTITALAEQPCEHLYAFQRTANFVVPARNKPMNPAYERKIKQNYQAFRERARQSGSGTVYEGPTRPVSDLSNDEFELHMKSAMDVGGPSVCGSVSDLVTNPRANERVAEYLRQHVRERVYNPATAERLCARGHTLGSRRVLIEDGYFEAFNQPNVSLVDIHDDGITAVDPTGVTTRAGHFPLDVLILATGFDSVTGAPLRIDITGRSGNTLPQAWANGPATYLGLMTHGFPNLFFITGPGSPSIRSNVMFSIEQHVDWIGGLIEYLQRRQVESVEPTVAAQRRWTNYVADCVASSLIANDATQYYGANVPGKPRVYLTYIGGTRSYRQICQAVREHGYEGFAMTPARAVTPAPEWSGPPDGVSATGRFGNTII